MSFSFIRRALFLCAGENLADFSTSSVAKVNGLQLKVSVKPDVETQTTHNTRKRSAILSQGEIAPGDAEQEQYGAPPADENGNKNTDNS